MSSKGFSEDVPFVLYLVPFLATAVYGLYLWAKSGVSLFLPTTVYLTVTRDPYLFMIGSFAVLLGVILDVGSGDQASRPLRMKSVGNLLQSIALASLVLSLLGAWYSNGFIGLSGTATDFFVGRYSIIFPAMLVLLSYLITIQVRLNALKSPKVLGFISLLLVPAVVYEVGKRDTAGGLAIALVLAMVGFGLFLRTGKETAQKQQ
jgi:hypothetical protein